MPVKYNKRDRIIFASKSGDVHANFLPIGTHFESGQKHLLVSPDGRKLLTALKKKYGKSLLRGTLPFEEKELLASGVEGKVYRVKIDGKNYALKEYNNLLNETGIMQTGETLYSKPVTFSNGSIRSPKVYFGSNKYRLTEFLEYPTLEQIKTEYENKYPKLKKLFEEKVLGTELGFELPMEQLRRRVKNDAIFFHYDKQTGKFEFIFEDIKKSRARTGIF